MSFQIAKGSRGRFKASGVEFEVVDAATPQVTGIRFRYERTIHYLEDAALQSDAENIQAWGEPARVMA